MSETVTAAADAAGVQQAAPSVETQAPVEAQQQAQEAPRDPRATMEAAYDKLMAGEPDRDESGRFAAKTDAAQPTEAAAPPAPPEGWTDKAKVDWGRLPRSVQDEILARTAAAQPAPTQDPWAEAVRPLRGRFEQHGLIPEKALPEIVEAWATLVKDPHGVLPELAKRFGVQWGGTNAHQAPAQAEPSADQWRSPDVVALEQKLAQVEAKLTARERGEQQAAAAAEQRLHQSVSKDIEAFAKDKPDFSSLRGQMAALMQAGQAKDLQEAYDMASWANPQTRAARIAAEQQAAQAKQEAERKAAAEKARAASAVNVRSDATASPAPSRNIRETMERAYDAAFARA